MTHRLLPWLSRDLRVILGEEHVEFMLQLVLSLIDISKLNNWFWVLQIGYWLQLRLIFTSNSLLVRSFSLYVPVHKCSGF